MRYPDSDTQAGIVTYGLTESPILNPFHTNPLVVVCGMGGGAIPPPPPVISQPQKELEG